MFDNKFGYLLLVFLTVFIFGVVPFAIRSTYECQKKAPEKVVCSGKVQTIEFHEDNGFMTFRSYTDITFEDGRRYRFDGIMNGMAVGKPYTFYTKGSGKIRWRSSGG